MNAKISVALLTFVAFIQLAHSIPKQRFTRETRTELVLEVIDILQGFLDSESSDTDSETSLLTETPSGIEAAESKLHPSVVTKDGSSPSSSFQSHIPSFSSYPSQLPSQFNPSQYGQYPSQLPSQFNPSQYRPSSGSATAPNAAQGSSNTTP